MIITGLTGGIGFGKTTFAGLLAAQTKSSRHFESWELVAEVAAALKDEPEGHPASNKIDDVNQWLYSLADIVSFHMHAPVSFDSIQLTEQRLAEHPEHYQKLFEYLDMVRANPTLSQLTITSDTKEAFRPLLQWLGGYLVEKVGSGIWYDEIIRRINQLSNTGAELVTIGGVRYPADAERVRNAGGMILEIDRPGLPNQDARDLTERERALIHPDSVVHNNGSLEDLTACAAVVYNDLCRRQLQPAYEALHAVAHP